MKRLIPLLAVLAFFSLSASAQSVKNASYQTVAYIKSLLFMEEP